MIVANAQQNSDFTRTLRHWRKHRKMSQLDLALTADELRIESFYPTDQATADYFNT